MTQTENNVSLLLCRFSVVFACLVLVLAGGCEDSMQVDAAGGNSLSSPMGMTEYLSDLPAVRSVEVWENPYGPGVKIETSHYDVYTTLIDPLMLRQVPGFVEAAYQSYQSQLPEPVSMQGHFTLYLFGTRKEWEKFTREYTGRQAKLYLKIKKGAYYLNDACVAYNIGRKQTFGVIAHEAWHQFNSKLFVYRLPSWLDEGIAASFETAEYVDGTFVFSPMRNYQRMGALRKTLQDGHFIPLQHLIALNPGYIIDNSSSVMAFYSQSYALVRFLREDQYGRRLRNYQNLLAGGLFGTWPLEEGHRRIAADRNVPLTAGFNAYVSTLLFSHYIESDIEQIEQEYLRFCRKLVYHIRVQ